VSVAAGANIEALSLERAHRTLTVKRQGGKLVTIPLPQRTPGAIGLTRVRKSSPMTSTS
jgi:integrase/recombinase XerD